MHEKMKAYMNMCPPINPKKEIKVNNDINDSLKAISDENRSNSIKVLAMSSKR